MLGGVSVAAIVLSRTSSVGEHGVFCGASHGCGICIGVDGGGSGGCEAAADQGGVVAGGCGFISTGADP